MASSPARKMSDLHCLYSACHALPLCRLLPPSTTLSGAAIPPMAFFHARSACERVVVTGCQQTFYASAIVGFGAVVAYCYATPRVAVDQEAGEVNELLAVQERQRGGRLRSRVTAPYAGREAG